MRNRNPFNLGLPTPEPSGAELMSAVPATVRQPSPPGLGVRPPLVVTNMTGWLVGAVPIPSLSGTLVNIYIPLKSIRYWQLILSPYGWASVAQGSLQSRLLWSLHLVALAKQVWGPLAEHRVLGLHT